MSEEQKGARAVEVKETQVEDEDYVSRVASSEFVDSVLYFYQGKQYGLAEWIHIRKQAKNLERVKFQSDMKMMDNQFASLVDKYRGDSEHARLVRPKWVPEPLGVSLSDKKFLSLLASTVGVPEEGILRPYRSGDRVRTGGEAGVTVIPYSKYIISKRSGDIVEHRPAIGFAYYARNGKAQGEVPVYANSYKMGTPDFAIFDALNLYNDIVSHGKTDQAKVAYRDANRLFETLKLTMDTYYFGATGDVDLIGRLGQLKAVRDQTKDYNVIISLPRERRKQILHMHAKYLSSDFLDPKKIRYKDENLKEIHDSLPTAENFRIKDEKQLENFISTTQINQPVCTNFVVQLTADPAVVALKAAYPEVYTIDPFVDGTVPFPLITINRTAEAGPGYGQGALRGDGPVVNGDMVNSAALLKELSITDFEAGIPAKVMSYLLHFVKRKIEKREKKKKTRTVCVPTSSDNFPAHIIFSLAEKRAPYYSNHPTSTSMGGTFARGGLSNIIRSLYLLPEGVTQILHYSDNLFLAFIKEGQLYIISLDGEKMESSLFIGTTFANNARIMKKIFGVSFRKVPNGIVPLESHLVNGSWLSYMLLLRPQLAGQTRGVLRSNQIVYPAYPSGSRDIFSQNHARTSMLVDSLQLLQEDLDADYKGVDISSIDFAAYVKEKSVPEFFEAAAQMNGLKFTLEKVSSIPVGDYKFRLTNLDLLGSGICQVRLGGVNLELAVLDEKRLMASLVWKKAMLDIKALYQSKLAYPMIRLMIGHAAFLAGGFAYEALAGTLRLYIISAAEDLRVASQLVVAGDTRKVLEGFKDDLLKKMFPQIFAFDSEDQAELEEYMQHLLSPAVPNMYTVLKIMSHPMSYAKVPNPKSKHSMYSDKNPYPVKPRVGDLDDPEFLEEKKKLNEYERFVHNNATKFVSMSALDKYFSQTRVAEFFPIPKPTNFDQIRKFAEDNKIEKKSTSWADFDDESGETYELHYLPFYSTYSPDSQLTRPYKEKVSAPSGSGGIERSTIKPLVPFDRVVGPGTPILEFVVGGNGWSTPVRLIAPNHGRMMRVGLDGHLCCFLPYTQKMFRGFSPHHGGFDAATIYFAETRRGFESKDTNPFFVRAAADVVLDSLILSSDPLLENFAVKDQINKSISNLRGNKPQEVTPTGIHIPEEPFKTRRDILDLPEVGVDAITKMKLSTSRPTKLIKSKPVESVSVIKHDQFQGVAKGEGKTKTVQEAVEILKNFIDEETKKFAENKQYRFEFQWPAWKRPTSYIAPGWSSFLPHVKREVAAKIILSTKMKDFGLQSEAFDAALVKILASTKGSTFEGLKSPFKFPYIIKGDPYKIYAANPSLNTTYDELVKEYKSKADAARLRSTKTAHQSGPTKAPAPTKKRGKVGSNKRRSEKTHTVHFEDATDDPEYDDEEEYSQEDE